MRKNPKGASGRKKKKKKETQRGGASTTIRTNTAAACALDARVTCIRSTHTTCERDRRRRRLRRVRDDAHTRRAIATARPSDDGGVRRHDAAVGRQTKWTRQARSKWAVGAPVGPQDARRPPRVRLPHG